MPCPRGPQARRATAPRRTGAGPARRRMRAGRSRPPRRRQAAATRPRSCARSATGCSRSSRCMQADLGGAFYEMAIRDHVRIDVLTRKAAELQRVDCRAAQRSSGLLELERTGAAGLCANCGAPYGARGPVLLAVRDGAGPGRRSAAEASPGKLLASSPLECLRGRFACSRRARCIATSRSSGSPDDRRLRRPPGAREGTRPAFRPARRAAGADAASGGSSRRPSIPAPPPSSDAAPAPPSAPAATRTGDRRGPLPPSTRQHRSRPRRRPRRARHRRPPDDPGRIKHLFLISLSSPGLRADLRRRDERLPSQMTYLAQAAAEG